MKNKNQSQEKKSDSSVGKTENLRSGLVSPNPPDTQNQSQAGVNRHTSSEEEEMVKHSPGTQNQELCANCGHHKKFHINEFTNESECLYGWRIGEKGVINIGCACKKFIPQNQSQSIRDKIKVAPYSASLSQNGASDTQNHTELEETKLNKNLSGSSPSGSAPSGDEEILKEVLNFGYYDSYDSNKFSGYELREYIKKAIQLKGQADDKKFEDWKKRLKEKLKEQNLDCCIGKFDDHTIIYHIDKLSGFNNDDEREGER